MSPPRMAGRYPCVALQSFLQVLGSVFSDVMCDAMIVERSKLEPSSHVGHMQAVAYSTRFCGDVMGAVLGAVVYNKEQFGWGLTISQILFVNGFAALALLGPSVWFLADDGHSSGMRSIKQQFRDLWMVSCLMCAVKKGVPSCLTPLGLTVVDDMERRRRRRRLSARVCMPSLSRRVFLMVDGPAAVRL